VMPGLGESRDQFPQKPCYDRELVRLKRLVEISASG
jgi:hypothetical protein